MDGSKIAQQTSVTDIMASGIGSSRMCDDLFLLLTLEWLDAADLVAFDTASVSNRCMKSTWLRVIRSIVDMRPMRGLLYTSFWIRWLIDRGVRTSSMRVVQGSADRITDATFEGICVRDLASLVIGDVYGLTDVSVGLIAMGCVNLVSIEMKRCRGVTCGSLAAIGQYCRGLTSLDITECNGIEDEGVRALANGCILIRSIVIRHCSKLTDASLSAIGESCRGLTSIDMHCNWKMTDVGISYLVQGCIHLQSINIGGSCSQLTDASLAWL